MVVSPNQEGGGKFDIIDGQQRLTTIFMLLYALIYRSEFANMYKIKYLLDKRGELKLQTQNQDFFKELLEAVSDQNVIPEMKEKANTQGKQNLYEVYGAILDSVFSVEEGEIEKYLETLLSMVLMWLEEPDSGRAIRTFQSVNGRGVPLKLLDKLKSLLIYYSNRYCEGANELDDEIIKLFAKADVLLFKEGSKDGTAYNLIHRCLEGKEAFKEELIKQCKKSDVKRAIESLIKNAYAYNASTYHYVFFEQNCAEMGADSLRNLINQKFVQEKEHIIPRSILDNEDEVQAKRLGFDNLEDLANNMNTFGNLLPLEKSLNSKASDRDLESKKAIYAESELAYIRRFKVESFNKEELKKRNIETEAWLKNEFFKEFINLNVN